jgi:two-component system sensor histidine kinase AlgZ
MHPWQSHMSFIANPCYLSFCILYGITIQRYLLTLYRMKRLNAFLCSDFIFLPRYRVWRHLIYWSFHLTMWASFCVVVIGAPGPFWHHLINMFVWVPVYFLFSYPLVVAIPHLLLKGKVLLFLLLVLAWGVAGLYIESWFRSYVFIPVQEAIRMEFVIPRGRLAFPYLCMITFAFSPMIIKFFKLCIIKQQDWMRTQQEKITTELQLLKAQVHPQFLLNTLNNIYSFSMDRSSKTPCLILKLSSLLSYMLYDCKAEEVRLEKEIESMKNYIDLEKERYGDTIEISWSIEGDIKDKFISPLLMLPFLENAFKHGISEQIEKPWLSVDVCVKSDMLRCKIANSKNEFVPYRENGTGITNVKKRLEFIYSGKHELKLNDEGNFFVISLLVKLTGDTAVYVETPVPERITQTIRSETLPAFK